MRLIAGVQRERIDALSWGDTFAFIGGRLRSRQNLLDQCHGLLQGRLIFSVQDGARLGFGDKPGPQILRLPFLPDLVQLLLRKYQV